MKSKQFTEKGILASAEIELNEAVWSVPFNKDLVAQAINVYRANQRKGTAQTKTRSDVSGGGKKPWKQKGTGRARHGSIRSPLWVGGGVTFGPIAMKRWKSLPKKMAKGAVRSVFSEKYRTEEVLFLESLDSLKKPSTKQMIELVENLKLTGSKIMFILPSDKELFDMVLKSGRNLKDVKIRTTPNVNIYDIIDTEKIIVLSEAVKQLEDRLI